jgi:hypothetical protein
LHVGTEGENGVFRRKNVLAGHDIPGGVESSDAVVCGNCIQPEDGIADEMNQDNPGDVFIWEHAVRAASAVLYGADVALNVCNMFIGSSGVEDGEPRPEHLELVVCENAVNNKPAGCVEMKDGPENIFDCANLTIGERLHSGELDVAWFCDKEWHFVDKHNVNAESYMLMEFEYVGRNRIDTGGIDTLVGMANGLPFERSDVRPKDCVGGVKISFGDRRILEII